MWCIKDILADDVTLEKLYENMTTRVLSRRDMKKRAQQINCIFPEIAVAVKTEAEDSLKGLLLLPGSSKKSFVGNPPKWRQNPYGNEEYVYELNRMKHWLTLLEAYELTGEVKFCQKVKAEFEDWFATCACPDYSLEKYRGDGPWRLLEVGIRGYLVLPLVFEYLIESQQMDINLFEKLIVSAWQHCTILYKFTLIFWPDSDHNHATMENLGLLALSSLIPEFKLAKIWQAHGLKELTRCIQNQVTLDGGQIEGSPSYHNGSVYWFSLVVTFSQKYDFAVDKSYVKLLKKMFEYSVYGTRPCGGNTPWGDCHTHIETMALAAVSCYIAFKDITYLQYAFNFYSKEAVFKELSENIWFISDIKKLDEDLKKVEQETFSIDLPKMSWQRELKQVFMRTGWSKDAISLMFSCRSPIQNGHAHMDVGGFDLSANGYPIICDPGVFTYKDDANRYYYKSSKTHNMVTVNNMEPWEYKNGWAYGPQKEGSIVAVEETSRMMYAICKHYNYDPIIIERVIAIIDHEYVLILDKVYGIQPSDTVQIQFHVDETNLLTKNNSVVTVSEKENIALYHSKGAKVTIVDGKISDYNDVEHPSKIVRFEYETIQQSTFAAVSILKPEQPKSDYTQIIITKSQLDENSLTLSLVVGNRNYEIVWENDKLFLLS